MVKICLFLWKFYKAFQEFVIYILWNIQALEEIFRFSFCSKSSWYRIQNQIAQTFI